MAVYLCVYCLIVIFFLFFSRHCRVEFERWEPRFYYDSEEFDEKFVQIFEKSEIG